MSAPKQDPRTGTWSFIVDVPMVAGKRQQIRRRGFATKKAAAAAMAVVVADTARGSYVRPTTVTLEQFLLEEWLPAKRSSLRPSTFNSYDRIIRLYVGLAIGAAKLHEVDGSMLNGLYGRLLSEGRSNGRTTTHGAGLAPKTVRNIHGVLVKAFKDAVRWGRVPRNPCDSADPPAARSPEMKAWTVDELRAFVAATSSHHWGAVWALLATTGMRRGEVLGLRWSDVDLEAGTVTIRSTRIRYGTTIATSTPKTARGNRTVAIGPEMVTALRIWRRVQTEDRMLMGPGWQNAAELVVTIADGSAPNPEAFSNLFGDLVRRAGLRPIRLHDVRHSYATAALAAGVPVKVVSQRIGHADVGVTLKVYAHVMPGDDELAAKMADQIIVQRRAGLA
jgi:integrase